MTLVRVPLTFAAALAFHISMSPPSTSDIDTPSDRRAVCATARFVTAMLTKGLFWASALTDTLVVLAPHVPALHSTLTPTPVSPAGTLLSWVNIKSPTQWGVGLGLALSQLTTHPLARLLPRLPLVTVAGTTLALAGACLQYAAYHALGQFYACSNRGTGPCVPRTAQAQARARGHAHVLITSGPYAFVRHPGYAGLVLCTMGLVVLQLDALRGNGLGLGGVGRGAGVSVGMRAVALACAVFAIVGALRRIRDEEQSLRTRFKGEWEAWAQKVPYRLVPGVY